MIPQTFHAFWDGSPLPEQFRWFLDKWRNLHPGWSLRLWNTTEFENEFSESRHLDYFQRPKHWSPQSNIWQWRSDIARYEILHRYGGVWVDCDLEPLRSIEPLIDQARLRNPRYPAMIARESDRWVNNAFIGCSPGNPFIHDILYGLDDRVRRLRDVRVNRSIGAHYVTQTVKRHPAVLVLDRELIYPFSWSELDKRDDEFPDAYTKHHWNNTSTGIERIKQRERKTT